MAASGAAMSLEYVCYNLLNSFSQACTTFVGTKPRCPPDRPVHQNAQGLPDRRRYRYAHRLSLLSAWGARSVAVQQRSQHRLNRLYPRMFDLPAYAFGMFYENCPATCGLWYLAHARPHHHDLRLRHSFLLDCSACSTHFHANHTNIMMVYPISLGTTAFFMVVAVLLCRHAPIAPPKPKRQHAKHHTNARQSLMDNMRAHMVDKAPCGDRHDLPAAPGRHHVARGGMHNGTYANIGRRKSLQ